MATLYELTDRLQAIVDTMEGLDPADIEGEVALRDMLAGTVDDLRDKSDDYVKAIRGLEADADALSTEAKALSAKAAAKKANADRLKATLAWAMDTLGTEKLEGTLFKLAFQANPPACEVTDEEAALAAGFGETVTTIKTDRKAMIVAWKSNPEAVAAFAKVTVGRSLRIR